MNQPEVIVETLPAGTPRDIRLRWRLFPAAFLMLLGFAGMVFVVLVFGALAAGVAKDYDLFQGPNSPELSQRSLIGMAILFGCHLSWFVAGRLLWKRKYLAGLLLAAAAYPLASVGANWMFSSSLPNPTPAPMTVPPPMQRFDGPRRRQLPPLAVVPRPKVQSSMRPWNSSS